MTNLKFTDLGLKETLVKAIDDLGFITPSPIQAEAIPVALEGIDIIGQAQTGTGKTAAPKEVSSKQKCWRFVLPREDLLTAFLLSTDLKSLRDGLCRYSFDCSIDNRGNPKKL